MSRAATEPKIRNPALRWLAAGAVVVSAGALLWFFVWAVGFRSGWFAFNLHFVLMAAAHLLVDIFSPRLDWRYFNVQPWEVRMYRRLGVVGFMRLLRRIGWTAALRDEAIFDGSRRTLASYERATRTGDIGHLWLFLIANGLVVWAIGRGWWDAALWIGSMNIVFHLYPIMLQRTQRVRLQGMLRKAAASAQSRASCGEQSK